MTLTLRYIQNGDDRLTVRFDGDFSIALFYTLPYLWEDHLSSLAKFLVVFRVLEDKRQNTEVTQICLVYPGKTLGNLGSDSQVPRG
jgi:hypothetical protein